MTQLMYLDKFNFRVIYLISHLISVILLIYMGSLEHIFALVFENASLIRHFEGKQLIRQFDTQVKSSVYFNITKFFKAGADIGRFHF